MLGTRELPDALVRAIVEKRIVCSMLTNTITGDAWTRHVKATTEARHKRAEAEKTARTSGSAPPPSGGSATSRTGSSSRCGARTLRS